MSVLNKFNLPYSFLNMWNVIIITVLMSLLIDSVTCAISGSVLIESSPHQGSYFPVSLHV